MLRQSLFGALMVKLSQYNDDNNPVVMTNNVWHPGELKTKRVSGTTRSFHTHSISVKKRLISFLFQYYDSCRHFTPIPVQWSRNGRITLGSS